MGRIGRRDGKQRINSKELREKKKKKPALRERARNQGEHHKATVINEIRHEAGRDSGSSNGEEEKCSDVKLIF